MPVINRTFVIRNMHDDQLFWNTHLGWVETGRETYFHEDDYDRMKDAVDGVWVRVIEPEWANV
jgi:hypothetical protein